MAQNVETWMFRSKNEFLSLFITILLVLVIGIAFSLYNIYIVVGLLILGLFYIQLLQAQYLGNTIRVTPSQFPELFEIFIHYAKILQIQRASLYIKQDPNLNAFSLGINKCTVVLTSALVEQFTKEELQFIIAHELGHYKAGHSLISSLINPVGMNNILNTYIFGFWQRMAEYTADRCGLVLTKDINSAISSLVKLSIGGTLYNKVDIKEYATQIYKSNSKSVKISEMLSDHPFTTNRIKNLLSFWKENFYKQ